MEDVFLCRGHMDGTCICLLKKKKKKGVVFYESRGSLTRLFNEINGKEVATFPS